MGFAPMFFRLRPGYTEININGGCTHSCTQFAVNLVVSIFSSVYTGPVPTLASCILHLYRLQSAKLPEVFLPLLPTSTGLPERSDQHSTRPLACPEGHWVWPLADSQANLTEPENPKPYSSVFPNKTCARSDELCEAKLGLHTHTDASLLRRNICHSHCGKISCTEAWVQS